MIAQKRLGDTAATAKGTHGKGVNVGTAKIEAQGDPVVDWHPRVSRNTAIQYTLQKADISSGSLIALYT